MEMPGINRPERLLDGFATPLADTGDRQNWPEGLDAQERDLTDRMVRLAGLMVADTPADDPAVLDEVEWYHEAAARYGLTTAELFTCLGQLCAEDEQVRRLFDRISPGLAAYQRNAVAAYARTRMR
ncbi:TipAS antibiotic-recognition domain-containing protein [Jiangella rhizosphaerae]|uniref:TipAS antibiotic-recognition domain-containing protein n=1 Tax=Jiangella rhizosphaerae TaxID=2293569 RepID=A0A418KHY2_9ACTN|nr:TipAS antibiotic-recognition domain-containing protein [Jiangella rhizosphaerae]RIQ12037.1 hypothetical protein DY240_27825 [Jiangella rhizosphaerae]